MGIVVEHLTKVFGEQVAVNAISFEAKKGEITGFLGPNGAGKSTTMKMAMGFIRPTSGTVYLNGLDVTEYPLKTKSFAGYLPEHNPLYLDMYVNEFLRFIAGAYGISRVKQRVEEVIGRVGLQKEQNKRLVQLSKGYRQRVGLAKALIHDPAVLILDEPTSGLDPNQILEIRQVIKETALDKTVILSTHIMQEVDAICDHVVIIDQGKLVANDRLEVLKVGLKGNDGIVLEFESEIDPNLFNEQGFELTPYGKCRYLISSERADLRAELLKITSENDLPLVSLSKSQRSLEEIFHGLTQQHQ